ncbi:MAG: DUF86 domain-containing protein [Bacteroidales bacterium]|nr:DUF86 domain-containing protein [Bacteroidales bacterium]
MREPERDLSRLEHILEAIGCVENYVEGISKEQLEKDKLHLHAVIYNVQIIGEAVYKLTKEFKDAHPEIPWRAIEKMRHILVHDYFCINFEILWVVITIDLPELKAQVNNYIKSLQ